MPRHFRAALCACALVCLAGLWGEALAQEGGVLVRIAEIEVDAQYLAEYTSALNEEAEASIRLEPGVISIFPMYQKEKPTRIRILEIYADHAAYDSHLASPHFMKYKTTTLKMVKSLKLVDMNTTDRSLMSKVFAKMKDGR